LQQAKNHLLKYAASLAVTCLLIGAVGSPADATPTDELPAAAAAALAEKIAPDGAILTTAAQLGNTVYSEAEGVETSISLDPSDTIEVVSEVEGRRVKFDLSLPPELGASSGILATSRSTVFTGEDNSAIVVQTLSNGSTRVQTVISDIEAPHSFTYGMAGYEAALDVQGHAYFVPKEKTGPTIPIESAWAVDSEGTSVNTWYEAVDGNLVQFVERSTVTKYPVLADPTWGWQSGAYGLSLNRSEVAGIKDYAAAGGMCAVISKMAPG